jgi:hypothetical protein
MRGEFWDRDAATVLSPVAGGLAPALWLWLHNGAGTTALAIGGPCVWAIRDLLVSYVIALPVLLLCRRGGVHKPGALWLVAPVVGAPIGYVLANPVDFAWTPTEANFAHGTDWGLMVGYMALFGLSGLLYAFGARQRTV